MQDGKWRPRVDPRTTWIEVDGEAIAIGPSSRNLHLLNPTGAALLQLLDGSTSVHDIAVEVSAVFGIPHEDALADVTTFAQNLAECGLLEGWAGEHDGASTTTSAVPLTQRPCAPATIRYLTAPPDP